MYLGVVVRRTLRTNLEWLRRLNALPRAGPGDRRRTNRWTGAAGARFVT
jgi:hypothetical protein